MAEYKCECCNFFTKDKTKYNRHCLTLKHQKNNNNNTKGENDNTNLSISTTKTTIEKKEKIIMQFECKYCFKCFGTRQSRNRHQVKYCKYNERVPYEKLAEMLNEKDNEIMNNEIEIDKCNNKISCLEKQIEKIMGKLKIHNINNSINVQGNLNNTILNFQLLNHNHTDYDFLSEKDFIHCIKQNNHCVKALIEKVHFNEKKPENMNIFISSIKGKFIVVYRDNKWQIRDRKQQIDDLYETNELLLENWYDEYNDKYPHIIESFTRYLKNKETNNDFINHVKYEILMMLYNKRDIVTENNEKAGYELPKVSN